MKCFVKALIEIVILTLGVIFVTDAQSVNVISGERKSPASRVTFPSTAVVTGYSVDGYVAITGNTKFIFPVSDNGKYRPFAATADGTMGAYFAANPSVAVTSNPKGGDYGPLPTGAPFPITSKDGNLTTISNKEYWDINGGNMTRITLTWNSESGIASMLNNGSLSKLYIVAWNGTKWIKLASTYDVNALLGGKSTLTSGSITTVAALGPGKYSAYTFGTDVPVSPAPSLTSSSTTLRAIPDNNRISVEMIGESNGAVDYAVEKSTDSTTWETFANLSAEDFRVKKYQFNDINPRNGENYYRLKVTFDDDRIDYKYAAVSYNDPEAILINIYPNPASERFFIQSQNSKGIKQVQVYDQNGNIKLKANSLSSDGMNISSLSEGIYIVHIEDINGNIVSQKLIVSK